MWVRLEDICEINLGLTHTPSYVEDGIPFVSAKDISSSLLDLTNTKRISKSEFATFPYGAKPHKGDVLFCRVGTIGHPQIVITEEPFGIFVSVGFLRITNKDISNKYLKYWMESPLFYNQVESDVKGATRKNLNTGWLKDFYIPIPPLNEQVRIVRSIQSYFALLYEIEAHKSNLQDYIKTTKSKVLSLAISGKLVPQDPNDEPAIELLHRINPSFKPCDTSHYENLPKNWGMVSIGQLCTIIGGLWTGKKPPFINVGVIRNTNFTKDFKLDLTNTAYLDVEVKQFNTRRLQYGDIILEKSGGSEKQPVGRTILFDRKEGEFSFSNFTAVLRIKETNLILSKFLHFALINAYLNGATRFMQKQTTGIHNLIMDKYMALSVPIPPLAEQKRIVEAIEKVFDKFNSVTAEL